MADTTSLFENIRMKHAIAALLIALFSIPAGCADAGRSPHVETIKSADDLRDKIGVGDVLVIHALDREHFAKGHIPGAINVDYEIMTPAMLPPDRTRPLVFYCAGGGCPVSRMAARKAVEWGYKDVSVFEAGIKGWQAAGHLIATGD